MAAVVLKGVRKSYGNNLIIKGADLEIADGEFVVLVGPSGCGKSTLLRMIAGLESISDGELLIDGVKVNDVAPKDRDIAMVFQSYALYPHMTVRENLAFGLKVRKFPDVEINTRVEEAALILDLTHLMNRLPGQLSGGQRQRVAMGRAIVRHPKVFLFDEPLSNLDAELRARMRTELKKLHARLGTTIIYVTHDQVEALTLADRIVVLNVGIVQQVGTPNDLYKEPANLFVATFIGSPAMNLFKAKISPDGRRVRGKGFDFSLNTPWWLSCADQLANRDVIMGIRPPHLVLSDSPDGSLLGKLEIVEPLGWESYLHLDVDGADCTVQIETYKTENLNINGDIALSVAPFNIHLFDPKTEESLRPVTA